MPSVPGSPGLQILLEPLENEFTELAIFSGALGDFDLEFLHGSPLPNMAKMHVHQMSRPLRQVVQNMRGVDDGARPRLGLALQESKEIASGQQVQIHGNFIEE